MLLITPYYYLAEGQGFEPWLTGPEPVVLPLDDPSIICTIYIKGSPIVNNKIIDRLDKSFSGLKTVAIYA